MTLQLSLFGRLLSWLVITLVAIGVVLGGLLSIQYRLAPDSPLRLDTGPRLLAAAGRISGELSHADSGEWDAVLERYSRDYGLDFRLYSNAGRRMAGPGLPLPDEVRDLVTRERAGNGTVAPGSLMLPVPPPAPQPAPHSTAGSADFAVDPILLNARTKNPGRYWAGIRMNVVESPGRPAVPATLLIATDSYFGRGLFWNPLPLALLTVVIGVLVALLWLGVARGFTRPIRRMTEAAERIAKGRFDTVVDTDRGDEIGRLGMAINDMSGRLDDHVRAQKRFLGDVSHELASPVARIRLGLDILESRSDGALADEIRDVQEEVQHMSDLVNELLSFSRAEVAPRTVKLEPVELAGLVRRAVAREEAGENEVEVRIPPGLHAIADRELLARATGNLLRNALRYAGGSGPIVVEAQPGEPGVILEVRDCGPGVPAESLEHLFEPFYKPDFPRTADGGGTGLGLAIVHSAVSACGGSVEARNLEPAGFAVRMILVAVDDSASPGSFTNS